MPQLDPTSFSSQIFWLAITFSLLYLFMSRYAVPEIGRVLRQRYDRIQSDIEQAEELKVEAMNLKAEYEASLRGTKEEASSIIEDAISETSDIASDRHHELDDILKDKLVESEKHLKKIQEGAVAAFVPVSAELSSEMVKKLTNLKIKDSQAKDVVSKLFKEAS
jgi:F-type H+-transporting ATPase subunit b